MKTPFVILIGSDCDVKKRARTMSFLLNQFWKRWRTEYLTSLRELHKATGNNNQEVKKGQVVLVHDDGPRAKWRLAVIDDVVTDHDGLIRSVNIRTSTGMTNRPISRLYPLEISSASDSEQTQQDVVDQPVGDANVAKPQEVRPTRAAALKARAKFADWSAILRGPREDVTD